MFYSEFLTKIPHRSKKISKPNDCLKIFVRKTLLSLITSIFKTRRRSFQTVFRCLFYSGFSFISFLLATTRDPIVHGRLLSATRSMTRARAREVAVIRFFCRSSPRICMQRRSACSLRVELAAESSGGGDKR